MTTFAVWDGAAWRTAVGVSVWDGSAWRAATGAWVWDGGAWRQGYSAAPLPTLDAPSISATWDFTNHEMRVAITPGANNPSTGMTWTVRAVPDTSATGGNTSTLTYIDDVGPEDGSQSCYTCVGHHADWQDSPESAEACATRGNAT